jgi:hypothetical protein
MATFTLDAIRDAAEAKYGSTDIEFDGKTLVLRNALKLSKSERKELTSLQDNINDGGDQEELVGNALKLVAADAKVAQEFLDLVGDDMTILAEVFDAYIKGTQAGEA